MSCDWKRSSGPVPRDDQILVRIHATTVNRTDCGMRSADLFKVGDRVFGVTGSGANAEFVCVRESGPVAPKPNGMTFEEAAAVCDGASLALACLRKVELRPGRSILIYGASGSVGTAGVQLAKYFGADVTAMCNTKNLALARSLGADEVVDYTQEDFTKNGKT
jgi:NADPH:quinone reductase-like Zn-dependent oxidoreductase